MGQAIELIENLNGREPSVKEKFRIHRQLLEHHQFKTTRASRRSAQWCLDAVSQCWTQKKARTAPSELEAAWNGYEHARQVYRPLLAESERE